MLMSFIIFAGSLFGLYAASNLYSAIQEQELDSNKTQDLINEIQSLSFKIYRKWAAFSLVFVGFVFIFSIAILNYAVSISFFVGALCALFLGYLSLRVSCQATQFSAESALQANKAGVFETVFSSAAIIGISVASLTLLGVSSLFFWYHGPISGLTLIGFVVGLCSVVLIVRLMATTLESSLVACLSNQDNQQNRNFRILLNATNQLSGISIYSMEKMVVFASSMVIVMLIAANASLPNNISRYWLMVSPFVLGCISLVSGLIAIRAMEFMKELSINVAFRNSALLSSAVFMTGAFFYMLLFPLAFWHWLSIVVGVLTSLLLFDVFQLSRLTQNISADEEKELDEYGFLYGMANRFSAYVIPLIAIAVLLFVTFWLGGIYAFSLAVFSITTNITIYITQEAYGRCLVACKDLEPPSTNTKISRYLFDSSSVFFTAVLYILCAFLYISNLLDHNSFLSLGDVNVGVGAILGIATCCLLLSVVVSSILKVATSKHFSSNTVKDYEEFVSKELLIVLRRPIFLVIIIPILISVLMGQNALSGFVVTAVFGSFLFSLIIGAGFEQRLS
jgi:Na+/H+-translocating membrane pyrophosphatase